MQCYVYICRHITRIQNDFLSSVRIKVHLEILTILAFRRHLSIYVYLFIFSLISSFFSLPTVPFSPPPPPLVYPSHFYTSHRARFFLNFFASVSLFNYFSLSGSARHSVPLFSFISASFSLFIRSLFRPALPVNSGPTSNSLDVPWCSISKNHETFYPCQYLVKVFVSFQCVMLAFYKVGKLASMTINFAEVCESNPVAAPAFST